MDVKFDIKGLDELNRQLKALPEDFRNKALNNAVLKATQVMRDEAIALVPQDTGNLAGAIRTQKKKSYSKWVSQYQVNLKSKGKVASTRRGKTRRHSSTYYGQFIEYGTKKMPARPFMRPAYDSKKEQVVRTFKERLEQRIKFFQRKINKIR